MTVEWDAGRCWLGVWVGINIRLAARGANIVKDAYVFSGCDEETRIYRFGNVQLPAWNNGKDRLMLNKAYHAILQYGHTDLTNIVFVCIHCQLQLMLLLSDWVILFSWEESGESPPGRSCYLHPKELEQTSQDWLCCKLPVEDLFNGNLV